MTTKKQQLYDSNFEALGSAAFIDTDSFAVLDESGNVPLTDLPPGSMKHLGGWAPSTNTPELADGQGELGQFYTATDAGTVDFGYGPVDFQQGDLVYFNAIWIKLPRYITKADVGLDQVDNTSDINKPISTATQTALDSKFPGSPYLSTSPDGGVDFFKAETSPAPENPQSREIFSNRYDVTPAATEVNDSFVLYRNSVNIDPDNTGNNYGSNSEGNSIVGVQSTYLSHFGDGYVHQCSVISQNVQLGRPDAVSSSGSIGEYACRLEGLTIGPYYTADTVRIHSLPVSLQANSHVSNLRGIELAFNLQDGAQVDNLSFGGWFGFSLSQNSTIADANVLTSNVSIDVPATAGRIQLAILSLFNQGILQSVNGNSISIQNNGTVQEKINGVVVNIDNQGTAQSGASGVDVSFNGNGTYQYSPAGVSVNMGNYDSSVQRRQTFSGNSGSISNAQTISTSSNLFFDQANIIYNEFHVNSGSPITSTSFLSNNFTTAFVFEDDMDAGILGLGATGTAMVGQLAAASGKTAALVNLIVSGASIPDLPGLGGTVQKVNVFNSLGIINTGGPNNVVIEELRSFLMPPGSLATAKWGIDIQDDTAQNHLAKSLVIGANNTTSNDSIALELADKKAIKLTPMTASERDGLTALEGMAVYADGCIQFYDGTNWVRTKHLDIVPLTASDAGNPGDTAFDSDYFYVCIATNTWKRFSLLSW